MTKLSQDEYVHRIIKFVETHATSYTPIEQEFIKKNILWGMKHPNQMNLLLQLYEEVGFDIGDNIYKGFISLIENNFDINKNIIEIGGGIIPTLGKNIALKQKSGTVTVYDPRLITDISHPDNLILKKELFNKSSNIENTSMIIGFMPCEATNTIIEVACENNLDFIIALCEGGTRPGYEWLETDDEWISHVKSNAIRGLKNSNLGTLGMTFLTQYNDPYPVIYNKK